MKKSKKKDFEIKFYESLIKERPNFIHALSSLGDAYTRKGFYEEGLEIDRRLVSLKPKDPVVRYNLSCSFSLLGDIDQSAKELKRAVFLGYDDLPYILKDPDLENLRKHPQFNNFFEEIKRLKSR